MSIPKHKQLHKPAHELSNIMYHFSQMQTESNKQQTDYGTGDLYTPVEVHTVTHIEEYPGITVTEIAKRTARTKGAVSQIIAKLEDKGLVRREQNQNNARQFFLYVTEKGLELSKKHKEFDEQKLGPVLDDLIALHGYEAVDKFFKILNEFSDPEFWAQYKNKEK